MSVLSSGTYTIWLDSGGSVGPLLYTSNPHQVGLADGFVWDVTQFGNGSYGLVAQSNGVNYYIQPFVGEGAPVLASQYDSENPPTFYIDHATSDPNLWTIEYSGPAEAKYWTLSNGYDFVLATLFPYDTQQFIFTPV